jgi:hypothetical protein
MIEQPIMSQCASCKNPVAVIVNERLVSPMDGIAARDAALCICGAVLRLIVTEVDQAGFPAEVEIECQIPPAAGMSI